MSAVKVTNKYDDIINLPHHVSQRHPRMPLHDRAAQFSPFAALTGHGDAVKETARLTSERIELDEQSKYAIDQSLRFIAENTAAQHEISITYFVPDERKEGGAYVTAVGAVKKIDSYENCVVMTDGCKIPIADILDISPEV